jgi:tetratricopeptide (TPR) repeat protein
MSEVSDYLGAPLRDPGPEALSAIDDFIGGFLTYQTRATRIIAAAEAHPQSCLANAYAGALWMLLESPQAPAKAAPYRDRALAAAPAAHPREAQAAAFLDAWVRGDLAEAERLSEEAVHNWPRDLAMLKLNQYLTFNRGDFPAMLRVALKGLEHAADVPQTHGMAAFGYEQCHLLAEAEAAARRALEMEPSEPWAQHALAHVMLTQGRIDEGEAFMRAASPGWAELNSFMLTHNWWHLALFLISQGRLDEALEAYDQHCWGAAKDYSQDQIGAVSLLARLEFAGADVGDRWVEVGEYLGARGCDTVSPFLSLQYLYGLARAGRPEAGPLLEAVRAEPAPVWREVALPAADGIAAYLAGDDDAAIAGLERALPRLTEIGGSHAQRDLFEQIHLAALLRADRWTAAQQTLEQRRAFDPDGVPLNRDLARTYAALGLPVQAREAAARARHTLERHA